MDVDAMIPELQISNYIATWTLLDPVTFDVGIQVFRPIGIFRHGDICKSDLAIWLPHAGDELAG